MIVITLLISSFIAILTLYITYSSVKRKITEAYELGYERGYNQAFMTRQTVPFYMTGLDGKKINQQIDR